MGVSYKIINTDTDIGQMWQKVEERPETNMSCITEHPIQIVITYVLQQ